MTYPVIYDRLQAQAHSCTSKCLNGSGPAYLADSLHRVTDVQSRRRLRSSSSSYDTGTVHLQSWPPGLQTLRDYCHVGTYVWRLSPLIGSRIVLWFLCDRSSAFALMHALVMTSVVLRRVRNCLCIIIIIMVSGRICEIYEYTIFLDVMVTAKHDLCVWAGCCFCRNDAVSHVCNASRRPPSRHSS